MDLGLKGKKVFVTASVNGIGLATVERFLEEGADVVINGRKEQRLKEVSESLKKNYGEHIDYFCGDMTSKESIYGAARYIQEKYGAIDVFVANLGSGKPESDNLLDVSEWERFYRINVLGTVELLDNLKGCLKNGNSPCVILISSVIAKEAAQAPLGYAASKSAVRTLNKYLSRLWVDDGIRVNCVLPGNIFFNGGRWEELNNADGESVSAYIEGSVPMNRFGKPEEVADTIVFLSSERAGFITGAEIAVDGGQSGTI